MNESIFSNFFAIGSAVARFGFGVETAFGGVRTATCTPFGTAAPVLTDFGFPTFSTGVGNRVVVDGCSGLGGVMCPFSRVFVCSIFLLTGVLASYAALIS